jgi:hypothetical protein
MNKLNKKLESLRDKGEASGFFFQKLFKKLGWKTFSILTLIFGGIIILAISFLLGLTKKEN